MRFELATPSSPGGSFTRIFLSNFAEHGKYATPTSPWRHSPVFDKENAGAPRRPTALAPLQCDRHLRHVDASRSLLKLGLDALPCVELPSLLRNVRTSASFDVAVLIVRWRFERKCASSDRLEVGKAFSATHIHSRPNSQCGSNNQVRSHITAPQQQQLARRNRLSVPRTLGAPRTLGPPRTLGAPHKLELSPHMPEQRSRKPGLHNRRVGLDSRNHSYSHSRPTRRSHIQAEPMR